MGVDWVIVVDGASTGGDEHAVTATSAPSPPRDVTFWNQVRLRMAAPPKKHRGTVGQYLDSMGEAKRGTAIFRR
jgi:hypothetical protein